MRPTSLVGLGVGLTRGRVGLGVGLTRSRDRSRGRIN